MNDDPRRLSMRPIDADEYHALIDDAEILARDLFGLKVLLRGDGDIIKLFRCKRRWSSARWWPYALRFARNAQALTRLGFDTVAVSDVGRVASEGRDLVRYRSLHGMTLREAMRTPERLVPLCRAFAAYLARMHAAGVLFRSVHFGNVLVREDGGFALIDISDMRIQRRPLNIFQRARNFRHFLRCKDDRASLQTFGMDAFVRAYVEAAGLSAWRAGVLRRYLRLK